MTSVRKAVNQLASELNVFGSELNKEINELKRNVEVKPVTGATLYRHCLEDLNDRLTSMGEELAAVEAVSLDAISLEELVGHCSALYSANHRAIAALETRLRSYGYRDVYSPLPPENALELLAILNPSSRKADKSSAGDDHLLDDDAEIPHDLIPTGRYSDPMHSSPNAAADPSDNIHKESSALRQPPNTHNRQQGRTAMEAMAPMTAMKARMRDDTPSSLSSPELMSPSMRMLLGKYAGGSSSGGSFNFSIPGSALTKPATTGVPTPRISLSPAMPLSPAFQRAAEYQQQQMPLPAAEPVNNVPEIDEETTMELKAQVIFNRQAAEARERAKLAENANNQGGKLTVGPAAGFSFRPSSIHSAAAVVDKPLPTNLAISNPATNNTTAATPNVTAIPTTGKATGADLQRAIAEALSHTSRTTTSSTSSGEGTHGAATVGKAAAGPHTGALSSMSVGGGVLPTTTGRESILSARSTASLAPHMTSTMSTGKASVPDTVPELRLIDENEYALLPAFIQGQISMEALVATEKAMHALVTRRCASGGGAGFTMDDVEAVDVLPVGKGKTFANALAKLGHVQLRVVYGQGTVYNFI